MEPKELIEMMAGSAEKQIDLIHKSMGLHLDESDRIHARRASETIVDAAKQILSDPTGATP